MTNGTTFGPCDMPLFFLDDSPVGKLAFCADDDRLTGVYFVDHHVVGKKARTCQPIAEPDQPVPDVIRQAQRELAEYFAGQRKVFSVPIAFQEGSAFQQKVWRGLCEIPFGASWSYGDLARVLGLPIGNARAIGSANARNPISIIVPCHRVIGASGTLTGYAGGLDRKHTLLALESNQYSAQHAFDFGLPEPSSETAERTDQVRAEIVR